MRSSLEVYDLASGTARALLQSDQVIEAPNWHPDGYLLVNSGGGLYRVPLDAPRLLPVDTGFARRCNNDHGFSRDGDHILFSSHRDRGAEIFRIPVTGGDPELLSPDAPSWFHGTAPDGRGMVYVAARGGTRVIDVFTKAWDQPEVRLTKGEGQCDGPEYSADGTLIYYNCDRTGRAQIWVMQANGTRQRQLFADDQVNWFPHPSPDGRHILYLAYPTGTEGHPRDLPVALCLMSPDGSDRRRVLEFTGGQGSINVPCWSPDSRAFAFLRYRLPVGPDQG
ncbi:MAG: hypothetical protein ABI832_17965 [bacterium]